MTAIGDIKIDLFEKQTDEGFALHPDWDELTATTPFPEDIKIPALPAPTIIPWPDSYPTAKQMLAEIDVQPVEFPTVAEIEAELAQRAQAAQETEDESLTITIDTSSFKLDEHPEDALVADLALKPSPVKREVTE